MTRQHSWLTWAQLRMLWSSWLRSPILVKGGHWAGCWAGYTTPCLSFTLRISFTHPIHWIETLCLEGCPPLWGVIDDFHDFLTFIERVFVKWIPTLPQRWRTPIFAWMHGHKYLKEECRRAIWFDYSLKRFLQFKWLGPGWVCWIYFPHHGGNNTHKM